MTRGYDRYRAREALRRIKPQSVKVLCDVIAKEAQPYIQVFVCECLAELGTKALEAKSCLEPLTDPENTKDKRVRASAKAALEKVRTFRSRRF